MSCWDINFRGFLPLNDPPLFLEPKNHNFTKTALMLENLAFNLSSFMEDRRIREELVAELRQVENVVPLLENLEDVGLERAMLLYSYFASSYVHATHENVANRIPKEIAIPIKFIADKLKRPPILAYASYCLMNWRRKNPLKPIELDNIELLQNFSKSAKRDEDWFILVHVDIEAKASRAINQALNIYTHIYSKDIAAIAKSLEQIKASLMAINATMNRMPEQCNPEVYYQKVRPYIFGFNNVVYEGGNNQPQTFRGETGAQSSIIPAMQTLLGIVHQNSMLTMHLAEMREYMPKQHRSFLQLLEVKNQNASLRDTVLNNFELRDIYNDCLREFIAFRKKHLEYAVEYIQKRVANPMGTGGTPFIPWLSQLVQESEAYFI